jgi:hypothetical protein
VSICHCVTDRPAHEGLAVWQAGDCPRKIRIDGLHLGI